MTDKQNFEKDINVPNKNNKYKLGRTKIEKQQIFENIKEMVENGYSLQNIADKYGVTRQAISLKMINCGFNVSQEVKRIKREKIKKLLEETSVNNVEKLNRKVKYYKTYNIRLRNDLTELKELLSRKEQECESLNNIINEAKNSKLDLKSFLVGEAIQKEYEQQLDQLKAENDELKDDKIYLQDRVGKLERAILRRNDELDPLKSDNKHLNDLLNQALKELEEHREALEKIKNITYELTNEEYTDFIECKQKQILQICDEVKDV